MKFISRYGGLRLVLRPSRKEVKEAGGDQIVIIHPPLLVEFKGKTYDTAEMFPKLQQMTDCCEAHRLKSEEQLIDAIKRSNGYGDSFNEKFEPDPKNEYTKKKKELDEYAKKHGLDIEEDKIEPEKKESKKTLAQLRKDFKAKFKMDAGEMTEEELLLALNS